MKNQIVKIVAVGIFSLTLPLSAMALVGDDGGGPEDVGGFLDVVTELKQRIRQKVSLRNQKTGCGEDAKKVKRLSKNLRGLQQLQNKIEAIQDRDCSVVHPGERGSDFIGGGDLKVKDIEDAEMMAVQSFLRTRGISVDFYIPGENGEPVVRPVQPSIRRAVVR